QTTDYNVGTSKIGSSVITPSYSNPMGNGNYLKITLGSGNSFNWDGKGDDGRILTTGRYFIEIKSNTAAGVQQQIVMGVTVMPQETDGITSVQLQPNPINTNQVNLAKFVITTG